MCPEGQWEAAKVAGATYVGSSDLVPSIMDGSLQFERCIATIDQMPILAKLARILGPKGLMPNVKTGTLTTDVTTAVKAALSNTPFKIEKETALFQMPFARPSFSEEDTKANLKIVMDYLQAQNKTTEDGRFIEEAAFLLGDIVRIPICKSEYGQTKGPKFMAALERLRAEIAERNAKRSDTTLTY